MGYELRMCRVISPVVCLSVLTCRIVFARRFCMSDSGRETDVTVIINHQHHMAGTAIKKDRDETSRNQMAWNGVLKEYQQ